MRISRHRGVLIRFSEVDQSFLRAAQRKGKAVDFFAEPESQIRRDLVVAAASRMELPPGITNQFYQASFNERVHIFSGGLVEVAGFDPGVFEYRAEPRLDLL